MDFFLFKIYSALYWKSFFFFCLLRKKCYLSGNSIFMDQSNGGRKWNLKRAHTSKMDLFCSIFLSLPFDGEQLNSTVKQRIRSIDHTRIVPLSKTRFTIDSNDTADYCASELRFSFSFFLRMTCKEHKTKCIQKRVTLICFLCLMLRRIPNTTATKYLLYHFDNIFMLVCKIIYGWTSFFMHHIPLFCLSCGVRQCAFEF